MNHATIKAAEEEARRFLRRAKEALDAAKQRQSQYGRVAGPWLSDVPRETGALRRSSMDLTRALAAMRRPG